MTMLEASVADRVAGRIISLVEGLPNTRMCTEAVPRAGWWTVCPGCRNKAAQIVWVGFAALRVVCWCPEDPVTLAKRLGLPEDVLAAEDVAQHDEMYPEPGSDGDEEPSRTAGRLGLIPAADLLAEQIPPSEWLISPWLETGCIAGMVAPPNLGKTLLAFYFATQVAAAGKRVAIIEEEGGRRGFQKRLDRAMRACGKPAGIDVCFKPKLSLMSRRDVEAMCEELKGYDLVIIDSFARVTTGIEENDTKEMGQVVAALDQIREATGATVLVIHHTGKAKWKPGEVPVLGDGRGSSALDAGLDTVLALAPVLASEQQPGVVTFKLHITKQRDEDNRVPPALVHIVMTGLEATVTIADAATGEVATSPTEVRIRDLLPAILSAIPYMPDSITREELQNKLGKRASDIRSAVNRLLDDKPQRVKELAKKRLSRPAPIPERTQND